MMSRDSRRVAFRHAARRAVQLVVLAAALGPVELHAQSVVSNTAGARYQTLAGTDSSYSNTVNTNLVFPQLAIAKLLSGPTTARVGEELEYTISYSNQSATTEARNTLLADTLPAGLEFVSAQPAAQVNGQILTWDLGLVAPGDSAAVVVRVRVAQSVRDTLRVRNIAVLDALNSSAAMTMAPEVELVGLEASQLALEKTADVLEVSLGETVPYTIVLENTGAVAIADLRILDSLPEGVEFSQGSLLGADSMQINGRELTFYVAGPLGPGETLTVRYAVAVLSSETGVIENRAYATAEAGFIQSALVVAWVRVRYSHPMETRTAIGKVWLDLDNDGRQDGDEPGVPGLDIWTDDGQVSTSDSEGKFSYQNVRPGHHGFRLDRSVVPARYRVDEDIVVLDVSGWTSPRINFRLIPAEAALAQVRLPVSWRFSARPVHEVLTPQARPRAAENVTLARFESGKARPILAFESRRFQARLAQLMAARPDCRIEIAGHADYRPLLRGEYRDNWQLSAARADSLAHYLRALGVSADEVSTQGHGAMEPVAAGKDPISLQLNRRAEVQLVCQGTDAHAAAAKTVEYEALISNPFDIPVSGVAVRFEPAPDSAVVLLGDSILGRHVGGRLELPHVPAQAELRVRAWAPAGADSITAVLENVGRPSQRLLAQVHNPIVEYEAASRGSAVSDTVRTPSVAPMGSTIEVVLQPDPVGWPTVTYPLPAGWQFVPGSARIGDEPAPDPKTEQELGGAAVLSWRLKDRPVEPLVATLVMGEVLPTVQPVTVPALRTAEEREADEGQAFIAGPAVGVFHPTDGAVLGSDRVYVGVRGEAGQPVALFDGDSLIAAAVLRVDGVHDFIAVTLTRGPHRLRVRLRNSWGQERWDSLNVHVTGLPAQFESTEDRVELVADGHSTVGVRVRVLDQWGVPVVRPAAVTVSAEGAEPAGDDVDHSSVGHQVRSDQAGWINVALRPGRQVGPGTLTLSAGDAAGELDLAIAAPARQLMLTGVGRIGFGAAPDAMGAITARGRLDRRTSVVLSYDSRKLDGGSERFGRDYDPLDEAQYPILGDASEARTVSASREVFFARLERGYDWLAVGDVSTSDFSSGLRLSAYSRSLTGGAARLTTGPIVWRGFGSFTSRRVEQTQIRGQGASGPYQLALDILAGTERVAIETRARENAERILSQQFLTRYVDYQIDYERGTLLFKHPVPAADAYENPVFIMVTYEAEGGGEKRVVAGARATLDVGRMVGSRSLEGFEIGATGVRSDEPGGAHYLAGADVRVVESGAVSLGAEIAYSETPDSSGLATAVEGELRLLGGGIRLGGRWMRVEPGFGNPSNVGLRSGTEEYAVHGGLTYGPSTLRASHERQNFTVQGVDRQRTTLGVVQSVGRHLSLDVTGTDDRFSTGVGTDISQAGEAVLTFKPASRFKLWTEGRYQFTQEGNLVLPNHFGGGAAWQVSRGVSLEGRHRQVRLPDGSDSYAVTSLGVRTDLGFGTQAWGSYQLAGGAGGSRGAAVFGLNNQLRLGSVLRLNSMFERRMGISSAPVEDPIRALPFVRPEEDYWTAGLGIELVPEHGPYRLSARGEYRDGDAMSSQLASLAGALSISRSLAILTRQEYLRSERNIGSGPGVSERLWSLWGLALRPTGTDAVNILTKFSWKDETNPMGGGVLAQMGQEQRLIAAAEIILAPFPSTELAGRYAHRRTRADAVVDDSLTQRLTSNADYVGARFDQHFTRWLGVRAEGRLLYERTSRTQRWDAAPSLVLRIINGIEVQGGYRFGDLRDPDFSVRGGHGWFVTFSARITEGIFPTAVEFWRPRF
jgi:uncharacterized repeat protein (TIGR01451 family)